jgi:hypothetical protein
MYQDLCKIYDSIYETLIDSNGKILETEEIYV